MNRDIFTGKIEQLRGAAMENCGRLLHKKSLIGRGEREKASGRLRVRLGRSKERVQKLSLPQSMAQYR